MEQPWTPDDDVPPAPRRDRPIPAPWYREDEGVSPAAADAQRYSRRAARVWHRVAVVVAILLVGMAVQFVRLYLGTSPEARPELALSAFYNAITELLGWWFVWWAATRR